MSLKIIKGRNRKKFKFFHQVRTNVWNSPTITHKLRKKKWFFFRFNNKFKFFPRIRKINKIKFFYKNSLNIRRMLKLENCILRASSLYKLYLKARRGNPRYLRFLNLLESRLDICLFRTGFFLSPLSLRKLILHKNIYLNGCIVTKPGILLKPNDLVQINFTCLTFDRHDKVPIIASFEKLSHLEIDLETFSFIYLGPFSRTDLFFKYYKDISFLNYTFKF